jgi:major vault protein
MIVFMPDMQQKDLVLSINEYAYVLDRTKGNVACWVGPTKTSLSTSDELVNFNEKTKRFEPCSYNQAIHLFTTAPENWYVILKNPADGDKHPNIGAANSLPDKMHIGSKVNIRGPVTFALYPGQMAKVIRGHALRSNQYLLARVYEADSANKNEGEALDAEGNKITLKEKDYINGQMLVIKGTEVSFYIPPTGIEVVPVGGMGNEYTREAVTLERLEYCILKDEDGNKRYVHGPDVVFPKPTESFVTSPSGGYVFRAIELSKISGIYVKVIAAYKDGDKEHPVGEELFITGNDQMIYYPRPEHAIINYDGKMMHHAIAIPEGEGRYIMDRLTGEIKTVKGPKMYLPDPRTEVVVKRKLTAKQCDLWYPGNEEVKRHNDAITEKSIEKGAARSKSIMADLDTFTAFSSTLNSSSTLSALEAKANISRGTSYTKPRTITLDTKYDGVVAIDVWTGYAVNVISKDGSREVVCGPKTILLDYDQTLEVLEMSTGRPKTTDNLIRTVYLRHENNKVSDLINIETKDFVRAQVKVSYCVNFDPKMKDKWFSVENYVKYLTDHERSLIKRMAKQYTIEEFYQNYVDLVRDIAIGKEKVNEDGAGSGGYHEGRFFPENGMYVHDCEVLSIQVERDIANMLERHQHEMVAKSLELSDAAKRVTIAKALAEAEKAEQDLRTEKTLNKLRLEAMESEKRMEIKVEENRRLEAEAVAVATAKRDLQPLLDAVKDAELARDKKAHEAKIAADKDRADVEKVRQQTYAETVAKVMGSISEDLVAALNAKSNAEVLNAVTSTMAPYALASGESVVDFTDKLLRGTTLEGLLKQLIDKK